MKTASKLIEVVYTSTLSVNIPAIISHMTEDGAFIVEVRGIGFLNEGVYDVRECLMLRALSTDEDLCEVPSLEAARHCIDLFYQSGSMSVMDDDSVSENDATFKAFRTFYGMAIATEVYDIKIEELSDLDAEMFLQSQIEAELSAVEA